jgi:hypothetical protein
MRYLLLPVLLFYSFIIKGQEKLSAGIEFNFPVIPNFSNNIQHLTFSEKPGCTLNCNYEIPVVLLKDLSVSIGVNFDMLRFERKYTVYSNNYISNDILPYTDANSANSFKTPYLYNPISNTTAYYIGLPLEFIYSAIPYKLDVSLGIDNTLLLYNNQSTQYSFLTSVSENGKQINTYGIETKYENKGLYKSSSFVKFGLSYNVYDKIYITASYNWAFTPLYESAYQLVSTQHCNLFTLGAKYYIWQYK